MSDEHIREMYGPEFIYQGNPVGIFLKGIMPAAPGTYRYEPFRGSGHYEMQTSLEAGEKPICSYRLGEIEVEFAVIRCSRYGELELGSFARRPVD